MRVFLMPYTDNNVVVSMFLLFEELALKNSFVVPELTTPYLISVCLARSSADSIGDCMRSTVRNAARLAVYDEMMISVKNHQTLPTIRPDIDLYTRISYTVSVIVMGGFVGSLLLPGRVNVLDVSVRILLSGVVCPNGCLDGFSTEKGCANSFHLHRGGGLLSEVTVLIGESPPPGQLHSVSAYVCTVKSQIEKSNYLDLRSSAHY